MTCPDAKNANQEPYCCYWQKWTCDSLLQRAFICLYLYISGT